MILLYSVFFIKGVSAEVLSLLPIWITQVGVFSMCNGYLSGLEMMEALRETRKTKKVINPFLKYRFSLDVALRRVDADRRSRVAIQIVFAILVFLGLLWFVLSRSSLEVSKQADIMLTTIGVLAIFSLFLRVPKTNDVRNI